MMRALVPYLALEVRRTLRDPSFLVFTVAMPVLMYLLYSMRMAALGPPPARSHRGLP